jgi:hypothetical protein
MRQHAIAHARHQMMSAAGLALTLILGPALVAPHAVSAQEQPAGWGRYRDRDFGMAFDFPRHIFSLQSAEQGRQGVTFSTPDGRARIRVFAALNEASEPPARYLARIRKAGEGRFTYVRTAPRFFVASGVRDGSIFYRRCNFAASAERRLSCFQLDYPENEKRTWDPVVTRISLSLRATAD